MDSRKLSPEELKEMKAFIVSRSSRFAEPSILIEIMDHFACKIEEILNENPSVSFTEAMHKAHESFGVRGFAPITAAWEAHTYKRYRKIRLSYQFKMITRTPTLALLAFSVLVAQSLYMLSIRNMIHIGFDKVFFIVQATFALSMVYLLHDVKKLSLKHPNLFEKASEANGNIYILLVIAFPLMMIMPENNIGMKAIMTGWLIYFLGYHFLLSKKMTDIIKAEAKEVEDRFSELSL